MQNTHSPTRHFGGGEGNERVLSRFLETNVRIPREWSHHPFSAARRFMTHPATQSSSFRQFLCRSQGRFCGNIVCLLSANRSRGTRRSNVRRSRHGRIGVPLGFFFPPRRGSCASRSRGGWCNVSLAPNVNLRFTIFCCAVKASFFIPHVSRRVSEESCQGHNWSITPRVDERL